MNATTEPLPPLPALKRLSHPDIQPTIIVDSREQAPLIFARLPSVVASLQSGDYSFSGGEHLFAIERKSIADLVACCVGENRERFERELHRLRGFRFKRLLVVGHKEEIQQHHYRSGALPKSVLHTLAAYEARYDVPVVWEPVTAAAAELIENWAWWFARELLRSANTLLRYAAESARARSETRENL